MTEESQEIEKLSRIELLGRIDGAWTEFNHMLDGLSAAQRTDAHDGQGWRVKDHLTHIAAWEDSLLGLLEGRDRNQALGLGDADLRGMDFDQINALIQQKHAGLSYAEALELMHQSHERVRAAIAALSDEDLRRPYSHYQPNARHESAHLAVINWIAGNTYDHYAEHDDWIAEWING
jgi:hypothetical protein